MDSLQYFLNMMGKCVGTQEMYSIQSIGWLDVSGYEIVLSERKQNRATIRTVIERRKIQILLEPTF